MHSAEAGVEPLLEVLISVFLLIRSRSDWIHTLWLRWPSSLRLFGIGRLLGVEFGARR